MQQTAGQSNPEAQKHAEECSKGVCAVHMVRGGFLLALFVGFACCVAGRSQQQTNNGTLNPNQTMSHGGFGRPNLSPLPSDEDYDPVMAERRMQALNTERQKQLVSDTNKLLKLAKELNDQVAANNPGSLTSDQMRKIAEIEKLAKSVRERMTAGVGEAQPSMPAPAVIFPSH